MSYVIVKDDELQHYGVLGMKWGVRRYRKNAGNYTKKRLSKFDAQLAKVEKAKKAYKEKKKQGTKDYFKEKADYKAFKTKLKDIYKRLKTDKQADQGKELYRNGKRIRTNNKKAKALLIAAGALTLGTTIALNKFNIDNNGVVKSVTPRISKAASLGGLALGGALASSAAISQIITNNRNTKIRSYYSHSNGD